MKQTIYYQVQQQNPVEDIAQDCWYVIIEKLPELELKISFKAWALSIARRKALDWIRKKQQSAKNSSLIENRSASSTKSSTTDNSSSKLQKVRNAIQQLPGTQRIVLELFYLDNLTLQEISSVLNISNGTVKSRLFYAREKLKQIIS